MTREQARAEINSRINELTKAKKRVGGYDTYICPFCNNGSGQNGDGISTKDGIHYKCFKCGESGDYLHILKKQHNMENETDIFNLYGLEIDNGNTPSRPSATAPTNKSSKKEQNEPTADYTQFFLQAKEALQNSHDGLQYLQSRGISSETAARLAFGYVVEWKHPKYVFGVPDTLLAKTKNVVVP